MSIELGTSVKGEASDAGSITLGSVNCSSGTNRCIFVGQGGSSGSGHEPVDGVTFNGSSTGWVEKWDRTEDSLFGNSGHYIVAPAAVSADVVVSLAGPQDELCAGATPMTGVDQSTVTRTAGSAGGSSTTAQVSGVASAVGDKVMGSVFAQTGTSPAAQSPSSEVWNEPHSGGVSVAVAQQDGAAGTVDMTWTLADATWVCGAVSFIPAEEGPPDTIYRRIVPTQRMI